MKTSSIAGLDLLALQRYFAEQGVETAGPLEAVLLVGGKSNLTYRIDDGVHRWVLRRPPLGDVAPTAHDVVREYRVIAGLSRSTVPVAAPILCCEDSSVLGVPFAVLTFVDGVTLRDGDEAANLSPGKARRYAVALVKYLAALHEVDYTALGLDGLGRPAGYLARQVRTWRRQWDQVGARDLSVFDALAARLDETTPAESASAIVHGDYRLDNVIFAIEEPDRIAAIVDWEMATLGDPLADLGLLQVYWDPITEPVLGVRHAPSANAEFPSADEMAHIYAGFRGVPVSALPFYQALGYFKLAVIAEGLHQRYLAGLTVGPGFETVGSSVESLLERGLETLA